MSKIVARWQDWTGTGLEHLVLTEEPDQVVAEAAILGERRRQCLRCALRYPL